MLDICKWKILYLYLLSMIWYTVKYTCILRINWDGENNINESTSPF